MYLFHILQFTQYKERPESEKSIPRCWDPKEGRVFLINIDNNNNNNVLLLLF